MNPTEYRDLVYQTADRVLEALKSASADQGRTAWELKMELKLPSAVLYMALGVLAREGQIELEPFELTHRVRPARAVAAHTPSHSDTQQPREGAATQA